MSQPLASMTGYARAGGTLGEAAFACEIRSVNGRGLDLRLRLAPGLDGLEAELRQMLGKALSRGSVNLSLTLERQGTGGELLVNRQALETVLAALGELRDRVPDAAPASLDGILALPGILEPRQRTLTPEAEEVLFAAILAAAREALNDLLAARRGEGAQLTTILLTRLDEIEALVARAEAHPARAREAILARLRQQIEALKDESGIAEERLAQEALLLATKADISEELDRLRAHIASARQLIRGGGAVGRRLDFLAQEFNREANTLCSKANAVELTAIGLDLKAAIDQLREQVQNIE